MGRGYVYEFLDADSTVIYVGSTGNIRSRIRHHFLVKNNGKMGEEEYGKVANIRYAEFSSRTEAFVIEAFLINALSPIYNTRLAENASLSIININAAEILWITMPKDEWMVKTRERAASKFSYPDWRKSPSDVIREVVLIMEALDGHGRIDYCTEMPWKVAMKMQQDFDGIVDFYHKFPGSKFPKYDKHCQEMEGSDEYWKIVNKYDTMAWNGDISQYEAKRMIHRDLRRAGFVV